LLTGAAERPKLSSDLLTVVLQNRAAGSAQSCAVCLQAR
jgi:hypothetical protein